jgi:hypothetical protein
LNPQKLQPGFSKFEGYEIGRLLVKQDFMRAYVGPWWL